MKITFACTLGLVLVLFLASSSFAQVPTRPSAVQTAIRVQSALVLIDIITQDPKNGLPVQDFRKEDFRVLNVTEA